MNSRGGGWEAAVLRARERQQPQHGEKQEKAKRQGQAAAPSLGPGEAFPNDADGPQGRRGRTDRFARNIRVTL